MLYNIVNYTNKDLKTENWIFKFVEYPACFSKYHNIQKKIFNTSLLQKCLSDGLKSEINEKRAKNQHFWNIPKITFCAAVLSFFGLEKCLIPILNME